MSIPSKFKMYRTAWYAKKNCYVSLVAANEANGEWYFNVHNRQENLGSSEPTGPGQHIVTKSQLSNFFL